MSDFESVLQSIAEQVAERHGLKLERTVALDLSADANYRYHLRLDPAKIFIGKQGVREEDLATMLRQAIEQAERMDSAPPSTVLTHEEAVAAVIGFWDTRRAPDYLLPALRVLRNGKGDA